MEEQLGRLPGARFSGDEARDWIYGPQGVLAHAREHVSEIDLLGGRKDVARARSAAERA